MGNRLLLAAWAVAFVFSLTQAWPLLFPPSYPMQVVARVSRAPVILKSPAPDSSAFFPNSPWLWVLGLAGGILLVFWCFRLRAYLQEKARQQREVMDGRFRELRGWMETLEMKLSEIQFVKQRVVEKELVLLSDRISALEARFPDEKKSEEPPREQRQTPKKPSAAIGKQAVQDVIKQLERGY